MNNVNLIFYVLHTHQIILVAHYFQNGLFLKKMKVPYQVKLKLNVDTFETFFKIEIAEINRKKTHCQFSDKFILLFLVKILGVDVTVGGVR